MAGDIVPPNGTPGPMIEGFRLGVHSGGQPSGMDSTSRSGRRGVVRYGTASSGKTLLLSILRGMRRPDAGDVLVSGESLYRGNAALVRAWRASCGHVPEQTSRCAPDGGDLFLRSALPGAACGEATGRTARIGSSVWSDFRARRGGGSRSCRSPNGCGRAWRGTAARPEGPVLRRRDRGRGGPVLGDALGIVPRPGREGNTVVLAERRIPSGGPWPRAIRSPSALSACTPSRSGSGSGRRTRLSERPSLWWIDWRLSQGPLVRETIGRFLFFCLFGFAFLPCSCREGRAVSLPTGTPSPRCCARRSLPPRRRGWRGRPPPFPRSVPRCTGTRRRRGRSSCARTPAWIRCAAPGEPMPGYIEIRIRPDRLTGRCRPRRLRPPAVPSSNGFLRERSGFPGCCAPAVSRTGWLGHFRRFPRRVLPCRPSPGAGARGRPRADFAFLTERGVPAGRLAFFRAAAAAVSGFLLAASGTAAGGSALFLCLRKFPSLKGWSVPRPTSFSPDGCCGCPLLLRRGPALGGGVPPRMEGGRYGRK